MPKYNLTKSPPWIFKHWQELTLYLNQGIPLDHGDEKGELVGDTKQQSQDKGKGKANNPPATPPKQQKSVSYADPPTAGDKDPDDSGSDDSDADKNSGNRGHSNGDQRSVRHKTPEQEDWERATGMNSMPVVYIPTKGKNIKINRPEKCSSKGKWKDVQTFDNWTQYMLRWMRIKGINPTTEEGLDHLGFFLTDTALTRYNQYTKEVSDGNVFTFINELCQAIIPSTNNEFLWQEWQNTSLIKDGKYIGVFELAQELDNLQI